MNREDLFERIFEDMLDRNMLNCQNWNNDISGLKNEVVDLLKAELIDYQILQGKLL